MAKTKTEEEEEMAMRFRTALKEVVRAMNAHVAVKSHFGLFSLVEEERGTSWSFTNEASLRCAVLIYVQLTHNYICDRDGTPLQYASSAFEMEMTVPRAYTSPRELLLLASFTDNNNEEKKQEENKELRARIRNAMSHALLFITPSMAAKPAAAVVSQN